eukprot:scaffold232585_cov77-Attheya_sp.AAC.6
MAVKIGKAMDEMLPGTRRQHVVQHCSVSTWHVRGSIALKSGLLAVELVTSGYASGCRIQIGRHPIGVPHSHCEKVLPADFRLHIYGQVKVQWAECEI